MTQDEKYIKLALNLAKKAMGKCFPNPMVGAVVVKNGDIVGTGYHHKAGKPHAEVLAMQKAGKKAKDATIYVTLEPCCCYGRTPPCTDLIMESKIKRVVFSHLDPNKRVCGTGKSILEAKGIQVKTGTLAKEAAELNEAFIIRHLLKRPLITLKLATSLDGFITDINGKSQWITGFESRKYVHKLRAEHQAILVGTQTILDDNPALTVRHVKGNDPVRIILDKTGKIPKNANVFADKNYIVFSSNKNYYENCEYFAEKDFTIENILKILSEKYDIISLFVEGGSRIISSFIQSGFYDYFYHCFAPFPLGGGKRMFSENFSLENHPNLIRQQVKSLDTDLLIKYRKEPFAIKIEGDRCLPA